MEYQPAQKKKRDVYCILFNDLMVVTKTDKGGMFRSTKKFEYKDRIPLCTASAYALDSDNENGMRHHLLLLHAPPIAC
jgi:hypothetical protein